MKTKAKLTTRIISLILTLIIFSSLILTSCTPATPGRDGCEGGHSFELGVCTVCGEVDPDYDGNEGDNTASVTADGILFENIDVTLHDESTVATINELFVGTTETGDVFGAGHGVLTIHEESERVSAVLLGEALSLYDISTGKALLSLSVSELSALICEQYGFDFNTLFSEGGVLSLLGDWYNGDFLRAVGNVNFALISEEINKIFEKAKDGFFTTNTPEGFRSVTLRASELKEHLSSLSEMSAYELTNILIRSALSEIPEDELPEKIKEKLDGYGIENIKLEDTVVGLLPYSLESILLKFKYAGGDIGKLIDSLDNLARIFGKWDSLSELVADIFSLDTPPDIRGILTSEDAYSLTFGALLKSILGVGDVGLSIKLNELYNTLKGIKLSEITGDKGRLESVMSALDTLGDKLVKISVDELYGRSAVEIYDGSATYLKYGATEEGTYEISVNTEKLSLSLMARTVVKHTVSYYDTDASPKVPVFTDGEISESLGENVNYTVTYGESGAPETVSCELEAEEGAFTRKIYLTKAVVTIWGENKTEYMLFATDEYSDGRTNFTLVSFFKR